MIAGTRVSVDREYMEQLKRNRGTIERDDGELVSVLLDSSLRVYVPREYVSMTRSRQ